MFWRILKKDLKRKKTMNVILLLFVVLAAVFVASGVNNVLTVMNGTDYFLNKAGVGDFMLITSVTEDGSALDEVLSKEPSVRECRSEDLFLADFSALRLNGKVPEGQKNTVMVQSLEDAAITFFDESNAAISSVPEGHIYVSGKFWADNALTPGDKIRITMGDTEQEFTFDGIAKDAFLGSQFMGNSRFLISQKDWNVYWEDEAVRTYQHGRVGYVDTDDVKAVSIAAGNISGLLFSGSRSVIKLTYVMDLVVALLVLLLSVCLMIVSFVVLKFTISFTIAEEFREIGVMKAIGIRNFKIRSLYIVKYMMMAVIGSVIGFFISIPFGRKLMESSAGSMVLGNDAGILPNLLGSIIVIFFIILLAYLCTGKVKKLTPIDAVRVGQTGERYKKKTPCRIGKTPLGASLYLAVNDVLSSLKRYTTIMVSFLICTLFVLVLVNTTATMRSPKLATLFAGPVSDLYYSMDLVMGGLFGAQKEEIREKIDQQAQMFTEAGMPAKTSLEIQYKYTLTFRGEEHNLLFAQGINTRTEQYAYLEGSAPQNKNEIAITPQLSEVTGAEIGDTVTIDFGEEKLDCTVTAYYQTMMQLGQVVRLHQDAPTDGDHLAAMLMCQVYFTDDPAPEEIEARRGRIAAMLDAKKKDIMNTAEYCADCVVVADTMEMVQYLLLAITLVVVVLVTILMERSFIADEKSQIAILKAIGFKGSSVVLWHVSRFGLVALVSVLLAAALSIPATSLCITPIFRMMGAVGIDYHIDPLKIFLLYPGIVFLATLLVAWLTALYTGTIKSSDTANIE